VRSTFNTNVQPVAWRSFTYQALLLATKVYCVLILLSIKQAIELRGQVVNIPTSYSEVPGSNLGVETAYPNWGSSTFSLVPPGKCRDSILKVMPDLFLPHPFYFIIHLSIFHSTLYGLSYWDMVIK
jgi:hypothetical protein